MSKGSKRRPQYVDEQAMADNWGAAFPRTGFDGWLDQLDVVAEEHERASWVDEVCPEDWHDYYYGGYSPADAFAESLSNARP